MVETFLCWLLGPRCPWGCGAHVFDSPVDRTEHYQREHAGD